MSSSWITSTSCSASVVQSSVDTSVPEIFQWLRFIFLSPCPQRALLSSLDLLFLLSLLAVSLQKLYYSRFVSNGHRSSDLNKPLIWNNNRAHITTTLCFKLSLAVTILLTLGYVVVCALAFTSSGTELRWKLVDGLFWLVQAVTHAVITVFIVHEWRSETVKHPLSIRIYWVANFIVVSLFTASGILRFVNVQESLEPGLRLDDIVSMVSLPFSLVLLVIGIRGSTGIKVNGESEQGTDAETKIVTGFASASIVSKAFWIWMNPVLKKGYKSPLKVDEVPLLSPEHRAERMSALFESKWPKPDERSNHPVLVTLVRCFWKEIAFTASLGLLKLCVMYVGPLLIQSFTDFAAGDRSSPYEGYYLLLILFCAKFVEVMSNHHFNFNSQKLGMLIRCTLLTSLYKKGLRLSCSARQAHGVGQIVNYMAVDAQQLSDMMLQLNAVWMMPVQLAIALFLMYNSIGVAALTALVGVMGVVGFIVWATRLSNVYQFRLMMSRDSRMKAMSEMLNYMRVIKFQAWEEHFNKRIQDFRESEFGWLSKFMYSFAGNMAVMWSTPVFISTLTFGTAILLGVQLDVGTVFTATTIFKTLQDPIRTFPQSMISISQAVISLKRLDSYLMSKELPEDSIDREEGSGSRIAVEVKDGAFSWDDESQEQVLKNINFNVNKGELMAIVGTVGSGKSSLLGSVLGEMHKLSGKVRVCGTTAYVAQTSWIQNGTVEENILFGLPMHRERYQEVIRVCSLEKDLEMMEFGDKTEIGERGINLSGGQKQRIQLARAVFQNCDIYLLDDIFSAVDAQTGSEIFKECVRGVLKNKTVLLVTHQVDFLHNVDLILVMRDGMIVQSGKYKDLANSGMDFKALVAAHDSSMDLVEMGTTMPKNGSPRAQISPQGSSHHLDQPSTDEGTSKLIEDEEKETGIVSLRMYKIYCTEAYGWWGVVVVLLLSILWQGSLLSADYWLSYETSEENTTSFNPSWLIIVYAIIALVSFVLVILRSLSVTLVGLTTAQILFKEMLQSILHAPMSFFDTTPSGRIMTRASTDQMNIDILLPVMMGMTLVMYVTLLCTFFVMCQYSWPTVFLLVPLLWLNFWYRGYYLASSRELTRLDSITKAPVIHHFSESISGVMTIRSFRTQNKFCKENVNRVNSSLRMDFHNNGSTEWLGFRLELMGSFVFCLSTMFMILLPSSIIKPENVGLSLSYGLVLDTVLFWTIYMSCYVENRMVSVERIKQFSIIESEAAWEIKDRVPPSNWPAHGNVELKDLQVRYRSNTPLILKGISLSIHGGEKIGVVGRTGSGKSTLIQVLFRLVEPSGGRIIIDDIDICTIGLHDLRSRFGIIPQDPVLFEGTVRSNIDPIGKYSDEEIWKSLERCQLKNVVAAKPDKLDSLVADDGDNWSVGQRQLLCLGRVMLKRSRILFMDEATASIDSQTDAVIQKIIREDFAACTIISIAHRIPTVMDCDRVMVIDAGRVKEYDNPARLLQRPSLFGALVQEYSNRSSEP